MMLEDGGMMPVPMAAPGAMGGNGAPTAVRVPKPKTRSEFPETWLWLDETVKYGV